MEPVRRRGVPENEFDRHSMGILSSESNPNSSGGVSVPGYAGGNNSNSSNIEGNSGSSGGGGDGSKNKRADTYYRNELFLAIMPAFLVLLTFGGRPALLTICFGVLFSYIFDLLGSVEVSWCLSFSLL